MKSPPLSAPPSWSGRWMDQWLAWRNRLLASRVFQRRAAAFVLTRPKARRQARQLFDLVAGFVYSQVLFACVKLRLFDLLESGPKDSAWLCAQLDLPSDACERLLAAAVSLKLLERRRDGRFGLGVLGAPLVGNAALTAMIEHHDALYADLRDPVGLLRHGPHASALSRYWPYAAQGRPACRPDESSEGSAIPCATDRTATYTTLMSVSQSLVADEILDAYDISRHRCLLDVGGGDGSFLIAAAQRAPAIRLALFDLPDVAHRARARLSAAELSARTEVHAGSFLSDTLPPDADLATLIRVIHDHDDDDAMRILVAVRQALVPGGKLMLAEPMAGTRGAEPMGDAYFGFYLFAMGSGRPRTQDELTSMLRQAGFDEVVALKSAMPLQTRMLLCRAPRRVA